MNAIRESGFEDYNEMTWVDETDWPAEKPRPDKPAKEEYGMGKMRKGW